MGIGYGQVVRDKANLPKLTYPNLTYPNLTFPPGPPLRVCPGCPNIFPLTALTAVNIYAMLSYGIWHQCLIFPIRFFSN